MAHPYPWSRRWTASPCSESDGLFNRFLSPHVVPEDDFDRVAGVVLLGAPGLRKTHELEAQAAPYVARGVASKVYGPRQWSKARWATSVRSTAAYKSWLSALPSVYW